MQPDLILPDDSGRAWFTKLRYPVALIQTFRPCDWSDLHEFVCEGERFNTIFKERMAWLKAQAIDHTIRYDTVGEDLEQTKPRVYRLFVEFANTADAIVYRQRWDKWDYSENTTPR